MKPLLDLLSLGWRIQGIDYAERCWRLTRYPNEAVRVRIPKAWTLPPSKI